MVAPRAGATVVVKSIPPRRPPTIFIALPTPETAGTRDIFLVDVTSTGTEVLRGSTKEVAEPVAAHKSRIDAAFMIDQSLQLL